MFKAIIIQEDGSQAVFSFKNGRPRLFKRPGHLLMALEAEKIYDDKLYAIVRHEVES